MYNSSKLINDEWTVLANCRG